MRIINAADFGLLIKQARKEAGLTQAQLAGSAGIGERCGALLNSMEKSRPYFYEITDNAAIIDKIIQLSQKNIENTVNQFR